MRRALGGTRYAAGLARLAAGLAVVLGSPGVAHALDPLKTPAQYVAHEWLQSDDGLPANYVPAIVQTRDGYLWLATQEGVVRFDGVRFQVLSTREIPALGTNDIRALAEDTSGALWIGTRGHGVVKWQDGVSTAFTTKEGLVHDVVLSLLVARDGSLWVGTRGGGVSHLKDGAMSSLSSKDGLASDTVWAIAELPDGTMAFGTEAGVSLLRKDSNGRLVPAVESVREQVSTLLADADGTLWVGSTSGLARVRGSEVVALGESDGVSGVQALLRDRDGNLWIAAEAGLRRLTTAAAPASPGMPTPLGALSTLDGDGQRRFDGYSLHEDREGNLWVGMSSEGLLRLQDGKVTTFGSRFVWTTYQDPGGRLWAGTDTGLFEIVGDEMLEAPAPSPRYELGALAHGREGTWVGTVSHGLLAFDGARFTRWTVDPSLATATIHTMYEEPSGTLWLGTDRGLERVAGTTITRFTAKDGMPAAEVDTIVPAPDGSLWIGGRAGLTHWKDDAFTPIAAAAGAPVEHVETILVDGDDVWVGTYQGGLNLVRDGKVGRVTTNEGLFNDVVFAIVDDGDGNLWMTCNRGIFHARKSELAEVAMGQRARVTCTSLTTSDGMKSSECNGGRPAGIRARDGLLWFSSTIGAVRVDPAHMRKNTIAPPVRIEQVLVDRAPVRGSDRAPTFAAGSRDFEFDYTALSFTAPERVRFAYQLEGFDKAWVDAGARRVAYYTNLAPGRYRFRVKAANDDGVWNEEGAELPFTLRPHFYQTYLFFGLCALGLVLAGAGSVRWRLLALRARAVELERKVDQRTAELARANRDLEGAFKSLAEKDALLHEDLLEAQAFQQRILPKLPSGGAVRFRALYRPADLVGGDIYDICEVAPGHYRVFVADTTGHGVQASLRTMVLKTEYDRAKVLTGGPARVLTELNRKVAAVYPDLEMRCSACCFDVIADGEGGAQVLSSNAAHPPLLRVGRGKVDEIYNAGTFLGVSEDAAFQETTTRLAPGERLLAYTDGLCEQEDETGKAFGLERVSELLATYALDAEGIVQLLNTEITAFSRGRPLADDLLLVCIECAGDRRSKVDL
jgi:ligand-binding sensor domain-containing protein/serine phosphatase RsbU (regulator of sigma subunit)